jgi:hypothetical protein
MAVLGKTVELIRFPEESHDLSRNGRPDRRVERLRRIGGWFERFLGTAATDRVMEEATKVLPVPVFETREMPAVPVVEAEPVVEAKPAAEAEPVAEEPAAQAVIAPEVETLVLETLAPAEPVAGLTPEPEIAEPEALPDLPALEDAVELAPEDESSPALQVSAPEVEAQPEPELVAQPEPEPEVVAQPEPEPEIVAVESEPEAEAQPAAPVAEAVESEPMAESAQPEIEAPPTPTLPLAGEGKR